MDRNVTDDAFTPPIATTTGEPCSHCIRLGRPCCRAHGMEVDPDDEAVDIDRKAVAAGTERCPLCDSYHRGPEWEEQDGKCNGVKRDHSGLCRMPAGHSTPHLGTGRCEFHGGCTPSHIKAAEREAAEDACRRLGQPIDKGGPIATLMYLLRQCTGDVEFYLERYEEARRQLDSLNGAGGDVRDELEARVAANRSAYHYAQNQLRLVSRDAARAGVEERVIQLAEETGRTLAKGMLAFARALGHELTEDVRREARRQLRLIGEQHERGEVIDVEVT